MKVFKKIANILLALLLLLTTSGITLNKHYCMGRLKSIAVFHKAESCMPEMAMEGDDKSCAKSCCEDVSEELKVTDLNKVTFGFDLSPTWHPFAVSHPLTVDFDFISLIISRSSYLNYKPPLIDLDIPTLVQSFLL
ncbi:hypothetical protein QQ020_21070 [Fulvivirgaceae bacterium BMA12]|uniref:Uncharacterized protein n=1 Tax=Agaribacillus aureus TaxID=3051825 RepID=A0ABT8LA00_9BACT|nr:hypothetical protein [Fulvivirgaceae bacterium BMA12]